MPPQEGTLLHRPRKKMAGAANSRRGRGLAHWYERYDHMWQSRQKASLSHVKASRAMLAVKWCSSCSRGCGPVRCDGAEFVHRRSDEPLPGAVMQYIDTAVRVRSRRLTAPRVEQPVRTVFMPPQQRQSGKSSFLCVGQKPGKS